MSKSVTEKLVENSISASLSAIEIYNKPNFNYRDQVFCILIVNAWELMFKAKILADNKHNVDSIYIKDPKGKPRLNRNKSPQTLDIYHAMETIEVSSSVKNNIASIIDIRDTSIHYAHINSIEYLVFTLGSACLKNYQQYMKRWFKKDLLEYNFNIMPLGYFTNLKSFNLVDIDKEPEEIKRMFANISSNQASAKNDDGFIYDCEIRVNLISAKKITESTDLEVSVNPDSKEILYIEKHQKLTDKYPYSYNELLALLKKKIPNIKQNDFNSVLKEKNIKKNEKYSSYNFRSKSHEETYKKNGKVPIGTPSIYNNDCFIYLCHEIPKYLKKISK